MNASPLVHRFARWTALAAFILIVAGASVTSTGSGLAVPDWPLSYGQWMPPMRGGVFFEHGHRVIAATVGLMVWTLAFLAWKQSAGPLVRGLSLAAAGAVVLQGLLGGITVLYGLAKPISVAHACLGQGLFCLLVYLAIGTDPLWTAPAELTDEERDVAFRLWSLAAAAAAAVFLQLALGAAYRHGLAGLAPHIGGACLAVALTWTSAYRALSDLPRTPYVGSVARGLAAAVGAQLLLGLLAFGLRSPIAATVHVALGATILALCVVLAARARVLSGVGESGSWALS